MEKHFQRSGQHAEEPKQKHIDNITERAPEGMKLGARNQIFNLAEGLSRDREVIKELLLISSPIAT